MTVLCAFFSLNAYKTAQKLPRSSFSRKRESSVKKSKWIPVFVRMTGEVILKYVQVVKAPSACRHLIQLNTAKTDLQFQKSLC